MEYNWQQNDWGTFTYALEEVEDLLFTFTEKAGKIKGMLKAVSDEVQEETLVWILTAEALKTAEIENEYLSRKDVMSSIRKNLGMAEPEVRIKDKRAVGIGKLMAAVRKSYKKSLDINTVKEWHSLLFEGQNQITVGDWRSGSEPMQVVSGAVGREKVHFQAPPSETVHKNMLKFMEWFNETAPDGNKTIRFAPIRSAIAHIYFESIHPFEDGNGRIGRALADKVLSQSLGYPLLLSLSTTIEANKSAYYKALETGQKSNEITEWIRYFLQVVIDAQQSTESLVEFTLKKVSFYDKYGDKFNKRQRKCIAKMFRKGIAGFEGGMTARKYMRINKTSKATATRDLKTLEDMEAFIGQGGGRSKHYFLNI